MTKEQIRILLMETRRRVAEWREEDVIEFERERERKRKRNGDLLLGYFPHLMIPGLKSTAQNSPRQLVYSNSGTFQNSPATLLSISKII